MNALRHFLLLVVFSCAAARGDIYRWDTGEVIPGTEDIEPGPGVQLDNWNAEGHNLRFADFYGRDLTGANFQGSWLHDADFAASGLADVVLTNAVIEGASFRFTTEFGFTADQLYSTASYQDKNLTGIGLADNDVRGWNFSGQRLFRVSFARCYFVCFGQPDLTDVDFSGADLRGVDGTYFIDSWLDENGPHLSNAAIRSDGHIRGLRLVRGESLWVRDYEGDPDRALPLAPVHIEEETSLSQGATLRMIFESDPWDSTISFDPGIPVELGGTLELTFADDVDVSTQIGRTFRVFDWSGVEPVGTFRVSSPYDWDTSRLYSTGEIALLAVPEPESLMIGALMFISALASWGRFRAIQRSEERNSATSIGGAPTRNGKAPP